MIRLINTTTCLPVDKDIEDSFFSIVKPDFISAIKQQAHANHVDIQFVNQHDLDLERNKLKEIEEGKSENERNCDESKDRIPDMDLLGVYFPHHPANHCPVIKVSPEKVMDVCLSLRAKHGVVLPLKNLYPTILHAVVIHELAHWLMDKDSAHNHHHCTAPWEWLVRTLEDDPQYDFHNRGNHCHFHGKDIPPKLRQWRHVVEESLANAFVLKQKFKADEIDALRAFIELQPPAYRAGLRWKSNLTGLLNTAASWSDFKDGVIDRRREDLMFSEPTPLEVLVGRLGSANENIGSFNFKTEFYRHKVLRLPAWQKAFEKDKYQWDDFLNGTFGVLHTFVHWGSFHGTSQKKRLDYLRQWSENGSAEGFDELNKALSEDAEEKGEFGEALKFQHARLANLDELNHNDYWHKQHSDEILESIEKIQLNLKP